MNGKSAHNEHFFLMYNQCSVGESFNVPAAKVQLGMLLRRMGYQSKLIGASRTRGWLVRERGLEEVNANRNIEGRG